MQRPRLAFLLLLGVVTSTSLAQAETAPATPSGPATIRHGYLSSSLVLGEDRYTRIGLAIQAALRLGPTPLYAYALYGTGGMIGTSYEQMRVGLEARHCFGVAEPFCVFGGVDVGVARDQQMGFFSSAYDKEESGKLVAPRIGVEYGRTFKGRFTFELPIYRSDNIDVHDRTTVGANLQLGGVYSF